MDRRTRGCCLIGDWSLAVDCRRSGRGYRSHSRCLLKRTDQKVYQPRTLSGRALLVPPVTATVSALAECLEEAYVVLAGKRDRIAWIDMVNVVGLTVVGRSLHVKNDQDVSMYAQCRCGGKQANGR